MSAKTTAGNNSNYFPLSCGKTLMDRLSNKIREMTGVRSTDEWGVPARTKTCNRWDLWRERAKTGDQKGTTLQLG